MMFMPFSLIGRNGIGKWKVSKYLRFSPGMKYLSQAFILLITG